jgi:PAS domain S-box-containing protein
LSSLAVRLQIAGRVYDEALETIGVPLYLADADGVFLWINTSAETFLGDVVGRRISSVVTPEQISYARRQFARKITGQVAATSYYLVLLDSSGRHVPARIHSVRLTLVGSRPAVFGAALPTDVEAEEAGTRRAGDQRSMRLTGRQHEILLLLGDGLGTAEIAGSLGISVETARNHIQAVMRTLGAHSRLEAVAVAHRIGLLPNHG